MKKHMIPVIGMALLSCFAACKSTPETKPERTILFTIDGMTSGMHERIEMPAFNALLQEGTLFKEVYLPLSAHPDSSAIYPWGCSIPNPVLMSGSLFIGQPGVRQNLIQASFTERSTAFSVNSPSYSAIREGFTYYKQLPKGDMTPVYTDEAPVEAMKQIILEQNPEFMRIHCQGLGSAGSRTKAPNQPYTDNIWHPESPWRIQAQYTDRVLGEFVQWLKENDLWESTVLIVMGDHGQADEGWHAPYSPGGNITQMLMAGKGIKMGKTYDYAEIIDVAPTIAWLHDVPAPKFSNGRILKEAAEGEAEPQGIEPFMKKLDEALLKYHAQQGDSLTDPYLNINMIGMWQNGLAEADYKTFVKIQADKMQ